MSLPHLSSFDILKARILGDITPGYLSAINHNSKGVNKHTTLETKEQKIKHY